MHCRESDALAIERGGMDVIADFASVLPVQIIGDMLGVPDAERGPLRDWSLAILGALEPRPSADARLVHQALSRPAAPDLSPWLAELAAGQRRQNTLLAIIAALLAGILVAPFFF